MNPDGTRIHRITAPAPGLVDANWSPDGAKIAAWTKCCNYGTDQILILNADGVVVRHLTNTMIPIVNFNPMCSPDGSRIAFERDDLSKGISAIFVTSADGREPRQILDIPRSARPSALHYRISGRKGAVEHVPKEIEQGGLFPEWGLPPKK